MLFRSKDRTRPVKVTEYLTECRRATDPWKMQHRMLRHKALIQGARLAFGFSGIHDEEEARDIIANDPVANAKPAIPTPAFALPAPGPNPEDAPPGAEVPPAPKPSPTASEPKPKAQTHVELDIPTLRLFLKRSGFTEADLFALWRENGVIEDSLASLEEVGEVKPSAIRTACEPWSRTLAALNARKAANQPNTTNAQ